MKSIFQRAFTAILIIAVAILLPSCVSGGSPGKVPSGDGNGNGRKTRSEVLVPDASGSNVRSCGNTVIDISNSSEGYIMVRYDGPAVKIKIQITGPDGSTYTYTSRSGDYYTFPLTEGDGSYRIDVLENVADTLYNLAASESISVKISDEFKPFLYPNQYVWFTASSDAVAEAAKLSDKSGDDLSYVENIYNYVTEAIKYDHAKAASVPVDYIPDIDATLASGKGICFDYASLMASMLRSQGIPTKLIVGYSGTAYHAWISVYLDEVGWVDNIIEFNGSSWSLMDPTLGANNSDSTVKEYVGDGSHYQAIYQY